MDLLNSEFHARNNYLKLKNTQLERDIAKAESRPPNERAVQLAEAKVEADRKAGLHPEIEVSPITVLEMMVDIRDCQQEIIARHNRRFPNDLWTEVTDIQETLGRKPDAARTLKARSCADAGGKLQP